MFTHWGDENIRIAFPPGARELLPKAPVQEGPPSIVSSKTAPIADRRINRHCATGNSLTVTWRMKTNS